jgi:ATP-dependent protease ClpP protease subunit
MQRKPERATDEIAAMLEDETWMDGKECVAMGFADQVTLSSGYGLYPV